MMVYAYGMMHTIWTRSYGKFEINKFRLGSDGCVTEIPDASDRLCDCSRDWRTRIPRFRSNGTVEWLVVARHQPLLVLAQARRRSGLQRLIILDASCEMTEVVAQLNPEDPDTDFLLGMQALAEGDVEGSIRRLEEALRVGKA
ncbi:MAG: hypothetical protein CM1200mP14_09600 [Gammaproteobacteria bacterium]|nr:MAG: hypothetical protein CM1200mP14_09600 [Gammaproteobacteria bacterium]